MDASTTGRARAGGDLAQASGGKAQGTASQSGPPIRGPRQAKGRHRQGRRQPLAGHEATSDGTVSPPVLHPRALFRAHLLSIMTTTSARGQASPVMAACLVASHRSRNSGPPSLLCCTAQSTTLPQPQTYLAPRNPAHIPSRVTRRCAFFRLRCPPRLRRTQRRHLPRPPAGTMSSCNQVSALRMDLKRGSDVFRYAILRFHVWTAIVCPSQLSSCSCESCSSSIYMACLSFWKRATTRAGRRAVTFHRPVHAVGVVCYTSVPFIP
ncbi:hypothetical protein EJ04DRAFT_520111 [Polyplosphaeria fusca]|uniref:Uncharacterized protein n=1 Tax=Polyplosphaeria fusca TaxID=682080 RepID=A0A9P4R4U1_9PLEO|nr:hypothetical protein EJ04DRAFT_520111 [Polyplosphaeria fusca]